MMQIIVNFARFLCPILLSNIFCLVLSGRAGRYTNSGSSLSINLLITTSDDNTYGTVFRLLYNIWRGGRPSDEPVSESLAEFDAPHVHSVWSKAIDRRETDPEGAITIARTLLETICKHILDDLGIQYNENADLRRLYKPTAEALSLAPSQHTEKVFKQILGGCTSVVEGLDSLRNELSDSHGKGRLPVKSAARHAELAVNLAGAMSTFLVSTWKDRKEIAT